MSLTRPRTSILDKPLSRGKGEVSLSSFALLFSELVQYSQSRVLTVPEMQNRWIQHKKKGNMKHVKLISFTSEQIGCMSLAEMWDLVWLICILCESETQSVKQNWLTCCYSLKPPCGRACLEKKRRSWSMPTTMIERITSLRKIRWSTNSLVCRKTRDR